MMHPYTFVHPSAKIGMNVKIDPFSTIHPNVEIGDGTWIGSNVVIMSGTRIGKYCKIFPGAVLGAETQDLKYKEGDYSEVIIGDHTTIREFVTIHRATAVNGKTIVGNHVLLMAYTHVAHDCIIGNHCIISNSGQIAGHVHIDDYAVISGVTSIIQFVKVGKHAFIGASSLLNKDVPPYVRAVGSYASFIGINSVGLRRRGFDSAVINQIQEIYKFLYRNNMLISEAIEKINLDFSPTQERDEITQFVEKSQLGIVKYNASQNAASGE